MRRLLFLTVLTLSINGAAVADTFSTSLTGNFTADDDVALFPFSLTLRTLVEIETFSYAGGANDAGEAIPNGGFDPVITLYDAAGGFIDFNDIGFDAAFDPVTGIAADSLLQIVLAPGSYQFALTQVDNFPLGDLSDGFLFEGDPNLTAFFGCPQGQFCDVDGNDRSSFYAVDLRGATVPEPSTLALLAVGIVALGWRARRGR